MAGLKSQGLNRSAVPKRRDQKRAGSGMRAATSADLAAIEALLGASALPTAGVKDNLEHFFVCENEQGAILGAAGLEAYGVNGLLRSVVVAASARRRGIAAALIERVVSSARKGGCQTVFLLTLDAERYFKRLGFAVIGRDQAPASIRSSPEFATLCPASATLMRKTLGSRQSRRR